eukprot:TRINITY_DN7646_c0_g3_i1.p2 TRINITY_DN7646_c0_g3~~TRINITY_DN7646_c0_g3_i1.p2  ORF type:complete len:180 (+),score=38.97 TRINITY_DN7646_c0_g3_i1:122-661(+)
MFAAAAEFASARDGRFASAPTAELVAEVPLAPRGSAAASASSRSPRRRSPLPRGVQQLPLQQSPPRLDFLVSRSRGSQRLPRISSPDAGFDAAAFPASGSSVAPTTTQESLFAAGLFASDVEDEISDDEDGAPRSAGTVEARLCSPPHSPASASTDLDDETRSPASSFWSEPDASDEED